MGTFLLYLELFHYSRLSVLTFVEDYPFGAIKSLNEDDVKFQMLFKKCIIACNVHEVCNVNFYRNWLTCVVNSPSFSFCFSSNPFMDFFISLFYMVLQFVDLNLLCLLHCFLKWWKKWSHQIHNPLVKRSCMKCHPTNHIYCNAR